MRHVLPNLNHQQIRFCEEYLISFNAYRAAKAAGYSENSARKGEMMHIPKIEAYLRLKQRERSERLEISHDKILREYAKIAFANIGNFYDDRGEMLPMCEVSESDKAAISFLQTTDLTETDGFIIGKVTKIRMHNKMAALDRIAKHLGFFNQSQESRVKNQEEAVAVAVEDKSLGEVEEETLTEAEIVAMNTLDEIEPAFVKKELPSMEEIKDRLLRERETRAEKEDGKILTFSPQADLAGSGKFEATGTYGADMQELLLRGTDD